MLVQRIYIAFGSLHNPYALYTVAPQPRGDGIVSRRVERRGGAETPFLDIPDYEIQLAAYGASNIAKFHA